MYCNVNMIVICDMIAMEQELYRIHIYRMHNKPVWNLEKY